MTGLRDGRSGTVPWLRIPAPRTAGSEPVTSPVSGPRTDGGRAADDRPPRRLSVSRAVDMLLAAVAVIVLLPVLVVVGLLVRLTSPGPALFKQVRVGRLGRPFVMYKFRTMHAGSDDALHRDYVRRLLEEHHAAAAGPDGLFKLAGDPRITRVGRWLRTTSLDELPQLLNVLRGEMSLVGPRPVLPWEAALFEPRHDRRYLVPPGITGLWQISGRNRLTMTEALDLDVEYVGRKTLGLDLLILLRTVPVILGRKGAR